MEVSASPARILLIDDNPGDILLAREALKEINAPATVQVARDGSEALDILRRDAGGPNNPHPDLILLDLNLPGRHGSEILREIKEDTRLRKIPVIILSSSDETRDVHETYSRYANSYIRKPAGLEEFLQVLDGLCRFWFSIAQLPRLAH